MKKLIAEELKLVQGMLPKANVNSGYGPWNSLLEAKTNFLEEFGSLNNIPPGLTFAVWDSLSIISEYWWDGSQWKKKETDLSAIRALIALLRSELDLEKADRAAGDDNSADFAEALRKLDAVEARLLGEIDEINDAIDELTPLGDRVSNLEGRVGDLEEWREEVDGKIAEIEDKVNVEPQEPAEPTKIKVISAYCDLDTKPETPGTSSINWETGNITYTPEIPKWEFEPIETVENKLWMSIVTFTDDEDGVWTDPFTLTQSSQEIINNLNSTFSYPFSVYKVSSTLPSAPTLEEITFSPQTNQITIDANSTWQKSPNASTKSKIWVSYNNYLVTEDDLLEKTVTSTGWTSPELFIDLNAVLDAELQFNEEEYQRQVTEAIQRFLGQIDSAIEGATSRMTDFANDALAAVTAAEGYRDLINAMLKNISDGNLDAVGLQTQIDELNTMLSTTGWSAWYWYKLAQFDTEEEANEATSGNIFLQYDNVDVKCKGTLLVNKTYRLKDYTGGSGYPTTANSKGVFQYNSKFYKLIYLEVAEVILSEDFTDALTGKWLKLSTLENDDSFKLAAISVVYDEINSQVVTVLGKDVKLALLNITDSAITLKVGTINVAEDGTVASQLSQIRTTAGEIQLTVEEINGDYITSSELEQRAQLILASVTNAQGANVDGTQMNLTPYQITFQALSGNLAYLVEYYYKIGADYVSSNSQSGTYLSDSSGNPIILRALYDDTGTEITSFVTGTIYLVSLYSDNRASSNNFSVLLTGLNSDGYRRFVSTSDSSKYLMIDSGTLNISSDASLSGLSFIYVKCEPILVDNDLVKAAVMSIVKDRINLLVGTSDTGKPYAQFSLGVRDGASYTYVHSDKFYIDSDVLARAITADHMVVGDTYKTYLRSDGSIWVGMGSEGNSCINNDGTGHLAGGLIRWDSMLDLYYNRDRIYERIYSGGKITVNGNEYTTYVNKSTSGQTTQYYIQLGNSGYLGANGSTFSVSQYPQYFTLVSSVNSGYECKKSLLELTVNGVINATGGEIGGWTIGDNELYAQISTNRIDITPTQIACTVNNNQKWLLKNDGSGYFASNLINWNSSGYGSINNQISWQSGYTALESRAGSTGTYSMSQIKLNSDGTITIASGTNATNGLKTLISILRNENKGVVKLGNIELGAGIQIDSDGTSSAISMKTSGGEEFGINSSGILLKVAKSNDNNCFVSCDLYKATNNTVPSYDIRCQESVSSYTQMSFKPGEIYMFSNAGPHIIVDTQGVVLNTKSKGSSNIYPQIFLGTTSVGTTNNTESITGIGLNGGTTSRINVLDGRIELLAGLTQGSSSVLVIDNDGIRIYACASYNSSSHLWNSHINQNFTNKGILLQANNCYIGLYDTLYDTWALEVNSVESSLSSSNLFNGYSSSIKERIYLASRTNGNSPVLNSFLSVTPDYICIASASTNTLNANGAKGRAFIQVTKNDGIVISGPGVTIGADVKILGTMAVSSDAYIAQDLKSGGGDSSNPASLFRANGSGYVANGKITWDLYGNTNIKATGTIIPETVITEANYTEYFTLISSTGDGVISGSATLPISGATYMLNLYRCSASIIIDNDVIKNHVKNVVFPFWTRRYNEVGDNDPTDMYVSGVGDMANYAKFHSCTDKVYSITILLTTSGLTNNDTTCNFYFGPSINGNVELMHLGEWIGTGALHYYVLNRLDEELKYSGDAPQNVYIGWYETDLNNYPVVSINLDEMFGFKFSILDQIVPNGRGSNYLTYQYTTTKSPIYTIYYNGMGAYYENRIF